MGLAEILAQKRADKAMPKPSVAFYLSLYSKAPRELYLNYFEDFQWLIYWLGTPTKSGQDYPPIPSLLGSYEVQQIAIHLEADQREVFWTAFDLVRERKA